MTRGRKIAAIAAGSLAGLLVAAFLAGTFIVQTGWFRNLVREKIVTAVEDATGGTVEISSFSFDWRHLRAQVRGFVIHGLEPAAAAPLLRADLVQVNLKMLPRNGGLVDIAALLVETPQANVIVYPDGHTNIPAPKLKPKGNDKTGLETIVDLAIGRFDLHNGSLTFAGRNSQLNASGQNLRAQVRYNLLTPSYSGEIDVSPLLVKSGNNPELRLDVRLPITAEKDKITLAGARFTTPQSEIVVSGSMDHLIAPRGSAHVNAKVALDEIKRALGLSGTLDTARAPRVLTAEVAVSTDGNRIQIQTAHARLGQSDLEASGTLRDASGRGSVRFNTTLALDEIGRLFRISAKPEGTIKAGGDARLEANNEYKISANLSARNVAMRQGATRLTGISLDSTVAADSRRIELSSMRLTALGGGFRGSASIQDLKQFHLAGNLRNFDIDQISRVFHPGGLGYDGVISGPLLADGNLRNTSSLVAKANLTIAPASRGVPVSGHIGIDYNGRAGTIMLAQSHLGLPHTTVDLSGSLGQQIQVRLVSRSFADFKPLAAIPVTFTGSGAATVNATVTGSLSEPRITGQVAVTNFAVDDRAFTRLGAGFAASKSSAAVTDAVLTRGTLQAQFSTTVGLHDWKPEGYEPLKTDAVIRDADLRDILALANQTGIPLTGAFNADAHISGTVGSPTGTADLSVTRGTVNGEPFDSLTARAVLSQTAITVPSFSMVAGPSHLDATASYQHPVNDLQRGTLTGHLASNQLQLAQFQSLVKDRPGLRGLLNLIADVAATVRPARAGTEFQLTSVNAKADARNLELDGKSLGDFSATATTAGSAVRYNVVSNLAGSTIRVEGQSLLTGDHETSANASIANLPIDPVLALAGRRDMPFKGTLAANAQLNGTLQNPRGTGTLTVTNGSAYGEPFTRLQASIASTEVLVDVSRFHIEDGPSSVDLAASFNHPAGQFQEGQLKFRARTSGIQLSRIHALTDARPGLSGIVQLTADGAATLHRNTPFMFSELNANLAAHKLSRNGKDLGNLSASATTRGNAVDFNVNSDLANARIQGTGHLDLAGEYPIDARLNFSGMTWSGLSPLLAASAQPFDATIDGQITVTGPTTDVKALRGSLQLTKLEAHSTPINKGKKPRVDFEMHNAGNIVVSLASSTVTVQSFNVTGPYTNLTVSGRASLNSPESLNLRANGNVKLEMLEAFDSDVFSSGAAALNATVTGSASRPVINGRLQLQNASFNLLSAPNGLSNASGSINFNGTEAEIQNLTGQTGGGKVTLAGVVSYAGPELQFRVQATAARVHIDYPDSVTTEANARLALTGRLSNSLLSGNVTILNVALHSQTDVASILTSAAPPPSSDAASTGLLGGMRFDVRIQTAPGVQFRTNLSQNLQGDANLSLRGTPQHPGMLGRFAVTSGDVIFFGAKYTVDQATVSFFNPNKINPLINAVLETKVQGVDVNLSVSGSIDKLKLSYHSDPPLEFTQIVSLLASGKMPTTDPVLAAHEPPAPEQNMEQAGASTLLGQAVANPVSGRLQRLFGVSKLSIDPQIVGGATNNPQATLTLQQQITRDITFTYIQDVSQSNPTAIRIEWAINPRFSAIAQRDVYGEFALDFFYKKRFH
jgi:translocation and assembly module TamB